MSSNPFIRTALLATFVAMMSIGSLAATSDGGGPGQNGDPPGRNGAGDGGNGVPNNLPQSRISRGARIATCLRNAQGAFVGCSNACDTRWPGRRNADNNRGCQLICNENYRVDQRACKAIK